VLDRLYRAALDRQIREQMEVEDEFLESWKRRDRSYEQALQESREREEEERRQKEEALAEITELKRMLEKLE